MCIFLLLHPLIRPYAIMEANIIEAVSLLVLGILASFNVTSSAHVTGGSDPRDAALEAASAVLLLVPFIVAGILVLYRMKCRATWSDVRHHLAHNNNGRTKSSGQTLATIASPSSILPSYSSVMYGSLSAGIGDTTDKKKEHKANGYHHHDDESEHKINNDRTNHNMNPNDINGVLLHDTPTNTNNAVDVDVDTRV
jgi:hypothetical protein